MLFAFGMMKAFGCGRQLDEVLVRSTLELLSMVQFIIVECITTYIVSYGKSINKSVLSQDDMDHVVSMGANKIRKSAAFGEIIIMTVYVPLFTLVGIEGKMFRPMANDSILCRSRSVYSIAHVCSCCQCIVSITKNGAWKEFL